MYLHVVHPIVKWDFGAEQRIRAARSVRTGRPLFQTTRIIHSLTLLIVSGFLTGEMNVMTHLPAAAPDSGLADLAVIRPVITLKWRVAMIRAAHGQEGFR